MREKELSHLDVLWFVFSFRKWLIVLGFSGMPSASRVDELVLLVCSGFLVSRVSINDLNI